MKIYIFYRFPSNFTLPNLLCTVVWHTRPPVFFYFQESKLHNNCLWRHIMHMLSCILTLWPDEKKNHKMVIKSQKKQTVHIIREHENCSNKDSAALGHYSALPQCSSGGWDGTPPDVGQRGALTRARCAPGTWKFLDRSLCTFLSMSIFVWGYVQTHWERRYLRNALIEMAKTTVLKKKDSKEHYIKDKKMNS